MDYFIILRNVTIFFATVLLAKYFIFLLVAPFYSVKEIVRQLRLAHKRQTKNTSYFPKISVIIPAWNEEVGVNNSIYSLLLNNYSNVEILVVNDGSTDNTETVVKEYIQKVRNYPKLPKSTTIRYFLKKNEGKGTALNYGIKRATGEIIVTMDADSVFAPDALKNLAKYFEDPTIDAVVGNVKIADNNSIIGFIQQLEYLFGFYFKRAHAVLEAEYVFGGACAAFRKSTTFDRIGLFDTQNKTEDIEMSMRIRYYGLKSVFAGDVICYTEGPSTVTGLINQRLRWKKGRLDTFIKYRSFFFSTHPAHNKMLCWFILPYALLGEVQLLFEPIAITLLVSYSILSGDYFSLTLGALFVFTVYWVNAFFNQEKRLILKLIPLFLVSWMLFYILVWIEYIALIKGVLLVFQGHDITWQNWQRKGVTV